MNKLLEVVLTIIALAGLYFGIPASIARPANSKARAEQVVIVADGTDPMPFCRAKNCTQ